MLGRLERVVGEALSRMWGDDAGRIASIPSIEPKSRQSTTPVGGAAFAPQGSS